MLCFGWSPSIIWSGGYSEMWIILGMKDQSSFDFAGRTTNILTIYNKHGRKCKLTVVQPKFVQKSERIYIIPWVSVQTPKPNECIEALNLVSWHSFTLLTAKMFQHDLHYAFKQNGKAKRWPKCVCCMCVWISREIMWVLLISLAAN